MGYEGQDFAISRRASARRSSRRSMPNIGRPASVDPGWRSFFEGLEAGPRPELDQRDWPLTTTDDLTAALDPTQMEPAPKPAKGGGKPAPAAGAAPSEDSHARPRAIRSARMMLIRTYRVRGHLAANLDPLGLSHRDMPADLTHRISRLHRADIDRPVYLGGRWASNGRPCASWSIRCAAITAATSASSIMHISDVEERRFLQDAWRAKTRRSSSRARARSAILEQGDRGRAVGKVPRARICRHQALRPRRRRKHDPGAGKRHQVRRPARRARDRLRHGPPRPPERARQCDGQAATRHLPRIRGGRRTPTSRRFGRREVSPRHSTDREFDGHKVHMSLVANPSHLEAADPVVLGKVAREPDDRQRPARNTAPRCPC